MQLRTYLTRARDRLPAWTVARPWLSIVALWLLYELPEAIRASGFHVRALRGSADLLALLTLGAVSYRVPWGRWVRLLLAGYAIVLVVFRLDRVIFTFLMGEDPLLYDQLFMLEHLVVLISDLWSLQIGLIVAGVLAFIVGCAWSVVRLLRAAGVLIEAPRSELTFRVLLAAWLLALAGSVTDAVGLTKLPLVAWVSPKLADNWRESLDIYHSVHRTLRKSIYQSHAQIRLAYKPDVRIFVVESYGKLVWDEARMRKRHDSLLAELEPKLTNAGFEVVSAFSTAPVRGARSWLADATLLTGTPVRYHGVFRHMREHLSTLPTLVTFFNQLGYETVSVSPADRTRLSMRPDNFYGYRRSVTFDTLSYRGPTFGWGLVPDQFSVGWLQEKVVEKATRPQFVNFHLVTSHSPWRQIPPRVAHYRDLEDGKYREQPAKDFMLHRAFLSVRNFAREGHDIRKRKLSGYLADGYLNSLEYDLRLLSDHIVEHGDANDLFILLGDHQPPLISERSKGYETPIHVISRDPALLAELKDRGFSPGMRLAKNRGAATTHAGIFSLLVRALVRRDGEGEKLPSYVRNGQELTAPR